MLRVVQSEIGEIEQDYDILFPIFYRSVFLMKKQDDGYNIIVVDFYDKNEIVGRLVYEEDSMVSLPSSSFGGLCLRDGRDAYFSEILSEVKFLNLKRIVFAPEIYGVCPSIDSIKDYSPIEDLTVYLTLKGSFYDKLEVSDRRRYKMCRDRNFRCEELSLVDLFDVHVMILDTKNRKGYPGTLSFDELKKMFELFPKEYRAFGCYDKEVLVAVVVNIKVNNYIFYNFYVGDKLDYRKVSPLVYLFGEVYDYVKSEGGRILDLGLSSNNGVVNEGLHSFKLKLDGEVSKKITFIKDGT